MPPETARALDQQVDRRKVGDDEIEVEIKRLLDDLRGYQNVSGALRGGCVAAEAPEDSLFDRDPISLREARMKQMRGSFRSQRGQFLWRAIASSTALQMIRTAASLSAAALAARSRGLAALKPLDRHLARQPRVELSRVLGDAFARQDGSARDKPSIRTRSLFPDLSLPRPRPS